MTPEEMADRLDAWATDRGTAEVVYGPVLDYSTAESAAVMLREAERLLQGSQSAHVPGSTFAAQWNHDRQQWLEGRTA